MSLSIVTAVDDILSDLDGPGEKRYRVDGSQEIRSFSELLSPHKLCSLIKSTVQNFMPKDI